MYRQLLVVCLFLAIAADLLEAKSSNHKRNSHPHGSLIKRLLHKQRQESSCTNDEFLCVNRSRCIPNSWICDGDNDCHDMTDEPHDCLTRPCPDGQVKCANGRCVNLNSYCSGYEGMRCGITITPGVECPRPDCESNEYACPHLTKCIRRSWVCDTDNDCLDNSDESHCDDRECLYGEVQCNNGQCLNETELCNSRWSGCRDSTDLTAACQGFTCDPGNFQCRSNGRCVANYTRCDGYDNCEDGSDEDGCPPIQCDPGYERCPVRNRCINARYFCDTDNDCGDNSDESEAVCSNRDCGDGFVTCENGQCLPMTGFCNYQFTCRNGTRTPGEYPECNSGDFNPVSDPPGPVAAADSNEDFMFPLICGVTLRANCSQPAYFNQFEGQSTRATVSKIIETDLSEICSPLLEYAACLVDVFERAESCQRASELFPDLRQAVQLQVRTLDFVCNEHVDVINRNKECILKLDDDDEPVLAEVIRATCREEEEDASDGSDDVSRPPRPSRPPNPLCTVSRSQVQCAKNVIADQCDEDLASVFDQYVDIATEHLCPATVDADAETDSRAMKRHARELDLLKTILGSLF